MATNSNQVTGLVIKTKNKMSQSRRKFIQRSMLNLGAVGMLGQPIPYSIARKETLEIQLGDKEGRLPREVWVAALTQHYIKGDTVEKVVAQAVNIMESIKGHKPDIVCLPETFHVAGLPEMQLPSEDNAEPSTNLGFITRPLAAFAKKTGAIS